MPEAKILPVDSEVSNQAGCPEAKEFPETNRIFFTGIIYKYFQERLLEIIGNLEVFLDDYILHEYKKIFILEPQQKELFL